MRPLSHDLAGSIQRIAKLGDQLEFHRQTVEEVWRDEVARDYLQQHLHDVPPLLRQLLAELATVTEQFESLARQLQDPDQY